jgi:hypothetical protein
VRDRSVNIQGFARDALLLAGLEILKGAHIVQTVGEFHEDHANIGDHGQQHLADVFRLARLGSDHVEAADLRDTSYEVGHLRAEALLDSR